MLNNYDFDASELPLSSYLIPRVCALIEAWQRHSVAGKTASLNSNEAQR
jgi:hypothetical protein